MTDLLDINRAIGELQADMREGIRQRREMTAKLDRIVAHLGDLTTIKREVEAMKPQVEDWTRTKQRGIGYLASAGLGGAALATSFHTILKKWGVL